MTDFEKLTTVLSCLSLLIALFVAYQQWRVQQKVNKFRDGTLDVAMANRIAAARVASNQIQLEVARIKLSYSPDSKKEGISLLK